MGDTEMEELHSRVVQRAFKRFLLMEWDGKLQRSARHLFLFQGPSKKA